MNSEQQNIENELREFYKKQEIFSTYAKDSWLKIFKCVKR